MEVATARWLTSSYQNIQRRLTAPTTQSIKPRCGRVSTPSMNLALRMDDRDPSRVAVRRWTSSVALVYVDVHTRRALIQTSASFVMPKRGTSWHNPNVAATSWGSNFMLMSDSKVRYTKVRN